MTVTQQRSGGSPAAILAVLGLASYVMVLDTTVMNVSIAQIVNDLHSSVTQIQGAITAFTLVMAATMIAGGKLGDVWGRRRVFQVGLVIYACGSGLTAASQNFAMLLFVWSLLEGLGAALIMPTVTSLIAANFAVGERAKAYGAMAAVTAASVATGPIIGGLATTYASWRYVFAGETIACAAILLCARIIGDAAQGERQAFDLVGAGLSALGLGLAVFGVLQAGPWGLLHPSRSSTPRLFGVSASFWLILAGGLVLALFLAWIGRAPSHGRPALVRRSLFEVTQLMTGLKVLLAQNLVQSGVFFIVPIFLTIVLGLSAIKTGVAVLPLSVSLVIAALGVPRLFPTASPRRIVTIGLLAMLSAVIVLIGSISSTATASSFAVPLLLMGLGVGMLASQVGNVIMSSVPLEESSEAGGLQYTAQNLGASLGTAIVGAVMVAGLATSLRAGVVNNPQLSASVKHQATVTIDGGVAMTSNDDLAAALAKTSIPAAEQQQIISVNEAARLDALRQAVSVIGLLVVLALVAARKLPSAQPEAPTGVPIA